MGFSAEMKDFINAYKTGQGINASRTDQDYKSAMTDRTVATTDRENDPETLKTAAEIERAKLANIRDTMATRAVSRGAVNARTALTNEQLRQLRAAETAGSGLMPPETPGFGSARGYGTPVPQGQGALPIGPSTLNAEGEVDIFPPGSEYNPRGTLGYEDGGLVPDDEEDETLAAPADAGALSVGPPAAAPTDVSAQSRQPRVPRGLEGVISPALVADAAKAGMKFGVNQYGLTGRGGIPNPRTQANARLFAQGHGGLTEQEMQAARQTVDPDGKLTDSQRNMAALGSVYQFWANKGEPEKAQRVAFQMLQYYRNASQRYAAIAAKAAEGGNVDLATKAALKAYANVPDGNDLELLPDPNGGIMYRVTGPKGEVVTKGVATPQQLAASAMGLASGGFDKAILQAAGAREDTGAVKPSGKGAGAARAQTAADRQKEGELVTPEIDKLRAKHAETAKGKPLDDEFWQEATDTTQRILQQNRNMTPGEAARAAQLLITPSKDGKGNFKLALGENDGDPATITFPNKMRLQLDEEMLDRIQYSRAARIKAAAAADEEAKKPGLASKVGGVLSDIGGYAATAVADDVGRAKNAIAESVTPETAARAKSALEAAKRMGGDAGAYLADLIKKDLSGKGGITPERVGRGIVDAAGAVGSLFTGKNKGAIPVDEIGPTP